MKPLSYLAFFFGLTGVFLAVFSAWSDPRSGRHRAMVAAGALLAWWSFCMMLVYGAEDGASALLWYQLSLPGILFLVPAAYWIYLDQAAVQPRVKGWLVGAMVLFGALLYAAYWRDGFYFSAFRPGPWGNVGVVSDHPFWYLVGSVVYQSATVAMIVQLLRSRTRTSSARLRRLYLANAVGLILTALLFGLTWILETFAGWPPMDFVAAGFYLVGVNFYLMGRYRYLLREPALDASQIGAQVPQAFVVLDSALNVNSANETAWRLLNVDASFRGDFFGLFGRPTVLRTLWQKALEDEQSSLTLSVSRGGVPLELNLAPHFDRFGDVCGAVAVARPALTSQALAADPGFTARELEILDLVVQGFDNKTIASTLFVSLGTVKNHLYRLYKKAGVQSRLELMNRFRPAP